MDLLISGQVARTISLNFFELGTERVISATIRNGPDPVTESAIWTSSKWDGYVGIRLQGAPSWTYPGSDSLAGFQLGALTADEEVDIEIKLNIPGNPGRTGENYVPIRLGSA